MHLSLAQLVENTLYFLALINPPSKVLFLSAYEPSLSFAQNFELSWKSSLAAFAMLLLFSLTGQAILLNVFRIEIYSLRICGGLIVFFSGWMAAREGRFFERRSKDVIVHDFTDISIIPLAAPLISGPGSITLALTLSAEYGQLHTFLVIFLALLVNFSLMVLAQPINHLLLRIRLAGPLVRITGLIVATVAVQMILTGLGEWLQIILKNS